MTILQTETQEQAYIAAAHRAAAKLQEIIKREGDPEGKRSADEYFRCLLEEELRADWAVETYGGDRIE